MMAKWIAWLEHWNAEAIRNDGLLTDTKKLKEIIFKKRYRDDRRSRREAA